MRWNLLKGHFSRAIKKRRMNLSKPGETTRTGLWQRRFREHLLRDQEDFNVDFLHWNPVKHGWVTRGVFSTPARRGYRDDALLAPLKENLAAAILFPE